MDKLPGVVEGSKADGVIVTVYGPEKTEVFKKLTGDGKDKFAFVTLKGISKVIDRSARRMIDGIFVKVATTDSA